VTGRSGEFLIAAAERAGTFIPRFCYHPRMKPVGMCRMCLVEVAGPRGATLQPACYVPVADGMEVITDSDVVQKAQDGVLEFLLVNHPLDCPVCDKGGECPLQDQTLAYGPGETRFVEEKRHWPKPIPISELVLLDRERCIQCGRCVRFANEIAGEAQIDFIGRGDATEVNIFEGHAFSSYFSGNTVQICPVGALTATPYRFTARPWDLDQVESTCTTCALGCRVAVQSSANRITRLLGIDSDPVNHSWLCDKGRYGYEPVNSDDRVTEPLVRRDGGELEPATWAEALAVVAERLGDLVPGGIAGAGSGDASGVVGVIGGARLPNEDAYAWAKLAKGVLRTDSVDAQLGDGLPPEVVLGLPRATIDEAAAAQCVVVLSGDLREELPVLYIRLRSAAVDDGVPVLSLAPAATSLDDWATASLRYRPGDPAALVRALAGGTAPEGADTAALEAARAAVAGAGEGGDGVVVVLGRPSLAEHGAVVADAALAMASAWPKATFLPALRRGNVLGALDMGLAPGILPGRVGLDAGAAWYAEAWGALPTATGKDAAGILASLAAGDMSALVLLGADPLSDFPDTTAATEALERAEFVVAVDSFLSASSALADVVLPAAMHHERAGTTTNIEGRVSRVGQKIVAPGQCWPDWMIAAELAQRMGADLGVASAGDIWDEIERLSPAHTGITRAALDAPGARDGIVAPLKATPLSLGRRTAEPIDPVATPGIEAVERQGAPPRAGSAEPLGSAVAAVGAALVGAAVGAAPSSRPALLGAPAHVEVPNLPPDDNYSLRLVAARRLYDDGALLTASSSLAVLGGEAVLRVHRGELERLGVRHGGRVRVRSARGSIELEARVDDGVPRGVAAVDFNLQGTDGEGAGAGALIDAAEAVVDVRLETP
ncbi:MAG TPA: NADH-quinone oxidoreductase subunit NuoG, partial [Acidimicrobiales bacterium]|nr:NADH-quinone oxidoreductase subunit NuoG [Acidimicrobiales bacterium]